MMPNNTCYRIPLDHRGCKYLKEWDENQSPLGSGMVWNEHFSECSFLEDEKSSQLSEKDIKIIDEEIYSMEKCPCLRCPGYSAVPTIICPKHDYEYEIGSGCRYCMEELEEKLNEAEKIFKEIKDESGE